MARTLLRTILGLRLLARSSRVITRGKLSTDTAAGRSDGLPVLSLR